MRLRPESIRVVLQSPDNGSCFRLPSPFVNLETHGRARKAPSPLPTHRNHRNHRLGIAGTGQGHEGTDTLRLRLARAEFGGMVDTIKGVVPIGVMR